MAQGSQNMTSHQANKWTNLRTFTIGLTGHDVDGTSARTWTLDEMLGASTSAYFYRGDKTWSNELDNNFYLNGHLYLDSGKHIYMNYASSDWPVLNNHNNGNISVNGAGSHLDLGYLYTPVTRMYYTNADNTVRTQFFEVNSDGAYALTRFGVNGQDTNYKLYVNGTSYFTGTMLIKNSAPNLYIKSNSTDNYAALRLTTDDSDTGALIFKNGSGRTADGGANTLTIRNDSGDVRLDDNVTVTGTLYLSRTTDAAGTADNRPALIIGPVTGEHLEFDGNEIMAKATATTTSTLYLQNEGGAVNIGSSLSVSTSIYAGTSITADGIMYAHGFWANRGDGERQIGVDYTTVGNLYLWSNSGEKGLFSSSGYKTGYVIQITNGGKYFYPDSILIDTSVSSAPTSQPTALSYGRLQAYGTLCINANTDNSGTEYVILTAGHGCSSNTTDGFWVGSSTIGTNFQFHNGGVQGGSWISGTHNAAFRVTAATSASAGGYYQGWYSGKTPSGAWSWGVLSGYNDCYFCYGSDTNFNNGTNSSANIKFGADAKVYNAVWNDYAEYRIADELEPGRVIAPNNNGIGQRTTERLQPGARIVSDTFGIAIGETDKAKTPVGLTGRVLAYPYKNLYEYHIGDVVCSAPNGTVDIMTRQEIQRWPERIIGIVNEIPNYEIWDGTLTLPGGGKTGNKIEVKGRIWIDVR